MGSFQQDIAMTQFDKPKPRFPRPPHSVRDDEDRPRRATFHDEDRPPRRAASPDEDSPPPPGSDPHEKLAKIAGLQAVSALFRRDPNQVIRLYYDEKMKKSVGGFCAEMAKRQRPYRLVEDSELQKIAGTVLHGGVVAAALPRLLPDFDLELAEDWAQAEEPVVILDGIGNPHNVGAIARTLAYFGVKHLLLSDHPGQAGLSDAAHRVAEGGLEFLDIHRVQGLAKVCRQLQAFYRVVGTSLDKRAVDLARLPPDRRPLALVLGNEEHGLSAETLGACEAAIIIRGAGQVQSLNVSATAAILIHQMVARSPAPVLDRPAAPAEDARPRPPQRGKPRSGGGGRA
jgi:TrmH RNA methyltransferase